MIINISTTPNAGKIIEWFDDRCNRSVRASFTGAFVKIYTLLQD
jgi:hypothetical protein